ncbi:hypothetical protein LguiA_019954 [Lonicera macranthoides]
MTTNRRDPVVFYAPIPTSPDDPQNYVVLPFYRRRHPNRLLRRCCCISAVLLLLAAVIYLLYPSDPNLTLVRLNLNKIKLHSSPSISLDLSFSLTLRVFNRDFFSLKYSSIDVSVGYRGQNLGNVTSEGGKVKARGTSYVNATLDLDGFQVIEDVLYLIEDMAKGSIPFETDSVVEGEVGISFIQIPIKARVWCEVEVDSKNQTIIHKDCYAKVRNLVTLF